MGYAYDDLAELVTTAAEGGPRPLNVYAVPTGLVSPPGVVIQPGDPWWEPASFDTYRERYELVAFVVSADPPSAYRALHDLVRLVYGALNTEGGEAFHLERFTVPRFDDSTGSAYLTTTAHLTTQPLHAPLLMEVP